MRNHKKSAQQRGNNSHRRNDTQFRADRHNASDKRRKSTEIVFDFTCPTPFKQMFRSETEAAAFIEINHSDDAGIRPYRCPCSSIHIGHSGTTRPDSKIHADVEVFRNREWCPYPKKPGFQDKTDAMLYASTRYLPHHVTFFDCACNGVHFRVSQEGELYRKEQLRTLKIAAR